MLKKMLLKIARAYQMFVSPFLGRHCRFIPSCSEYAVLAIKKHGAWKGAWLSVWRVLRCSPLSRGGVDLP